MRRKGWKILEPSAPKSDYYGMRIPKPRLQALALLLLFSALAGPAAAAEELWSEAGFFVDLPEGFALSGGDGKSRFAFVDPAAGMEFDILLYEAGRYAGAETLAAESLKKLGSGGERETFAYEGREAVFAELSFDLGGAAKRGYAVFIAGRKPAGASTSGAASRSGAGAGPSEAGAKPLPEPHVALLAYSDEGRFEAYADFVLSCLDSFSADRAARRAPGPLSQYLLPPSEPREKKSLAFGGTRLELPWDQAGADQCLSTAGREFRVLEAYGGTDELWKAAWARCFRMIYRESARRLDRLALELDRLLPDDPTDAARALLAWVQGFRYERDQAGIDFVDPLTAAFEGRGDCDSRAMVMAIVLERRGIDAILMLSRDYSHAMAAVDVPGGGQRFPFGGREWLVAETTADVGLGMIAADQADWKKWLGVEFGE